MSKKKKHDGPRVLILDVETAPMEALVWGTFDQNIPNDMILKDWSLLSWAARWEDDPEGKVMYMDTRNRKDPRDDSKIIKPLWDLMNEASIIVGQNSKRFDVRKINSRFKAYKMQPPSTYRQLDTLIINKRHFADTSNKLDWQSEKHNKKYKKLKHSKFPGIKLWKECLNKNIEAFREMEVYNKHDVLSTEELFQTLKGWDNSINYSVYSESFHHTCKCGSTSLQKNGFFYSNAGQFQRYKCTKCGSETRDKKNMLSKEKRDSLKVGTPR